MMQFLPGVAFGLTVTVCASMLAQGSRSQSVTATAVAHTALTVFANPNSQSLPAGTDLTTGANLNALSFSGGGASMAISLVQSPTLAYRIDASAGSSGAAASYLGETVLTITPASGSLTGILRITFEYSPGSYGPGNAAVDVGNDGSIEWTQAGGPTQVHIIPVSQSGSLLVRTITSASVFQPVPPGEIRTGDLTIEFLPGWNESGDAGETRPTAQIPQGIGPMESIAGWIGADDCDMFWIHVDDPASFEATTVGGAGFDTQLWLFDRFGHGISFHDDVDTITPIRQSRLTSQFVHSPGDYLLAITCYDRDATSSGGDIWLDSPYDVERQPDGAGAGSPLTNWTGSTSSGGAYTIFLSGVSFPGRLIAVDSNRGLWSIAPETGQTTQIGTVSSNVGTPEALAYDPIRDVLFLSNGTSLYSLHPHTGLATLIGSFGTTLRDLQFDLSTGQLYALAGFPPFSPNQLYRIDPATAVATLVGNAPLPSTADALIHDPRSNTLFALSGGSTYVVDRLTGATTLIGSSGTTAPIQGTRHADTGLAYILDNLAFFLNLRVLDLETGQNASIGAITPTQLRGLAFVPARSGVADYGTGCAGQGGVSPVLRAVGPFPLTGTMTYELSGCAPLSLGFFAFGLEPVWVPLPFPGACPVHISPLIHIDGLFVTAPGSPGSGTATFTVPLVPSSAGLELATQGVVLESIDINQMRTSNGVLILQ